MIKIIQNSDLHCRFQAPTWQK